MGRIITLDVSLRATGYAVVDASQQPEKLLQYGYIPTMPDKKRGGRRTEDDIRRVSQIVLQLRTLLDEWQPGLIVAELPSWSQSSRGAVAQGISLGVLGALRVMNAVPCLWVDPQETKIGATGGRKASKGQVQAAVVRAWPALECRNDDEREAVCDSLGALMFARSMDLYLMAARRQEVRADAS